MRKVFILLKKIISTIQYQLIALGEIIKYRLRVKEHLAECPQPKLTKAQKTSIQEFYASKGYGKINTDWHRFYSGAYGEFSNFFMPNTLFSSKIETALNRNEFKVLQDKNLLDRLFSNVKQPNTVVKNINGFFYKDSELIEENEAIKLIMKHERLLIKPSIDSGGGKNVKLFTIDSNDSAKVIKDMSGMFKEYKRDFIIQEIIEQSDFMTSLNPTSLNTIRISTYLRPSESVVLSAMVRMGGEGMEIDNMTAGGLWSAILPDGSLAQHAYDDHYARVTKYVNNVSLNKLSIPNFDRVKKKVKELHYQVPYFKVISWDIALDKNNDPVLIEINVIDQSTEQQTQVGPFFGKYTGEVLSIGNGVPQYI